MDSMSTGLVLAFAFGANLPLGWWRRGQRRFSPAWFIGIHASIPFLIAMRIALGVPFWAVPLEVVLVLAGQVAGSRLGS